MIIMKILIMFDYMVNMIVMIRIRKMASAIVMLMLLLLPSVFFLHCFALFVSLDYGIYHLYNKPFIIIIIIIPFEVAW